MGDVVDFFSDVGESVYKPLAGEKTSKQKKKESDATNQAAANAQAAIRQAEYEEQAAKGRTRTRERRRHGVQSTLITGGPAPDLSGLGDANKTLLGS